MSSPDWKMAVAMDGATEVRVARAEDGTASIRLSSGPVSIVAAIDSRAAAFVLDRPTPTEAEAA